MLAQEVAIDGLDGVGVPLGAGRGDGDRGDHLGRPGRKQNELVRKQNGFARVVRDEDRRGRPRRPDFDQQLPQSIRGPLVERDEGLVQQQQVRLGGEGAGKCHAACQAQRQFLRIARQLVGDADGLRQMLEVGFGEAWIGDEHDILLHRAPRKQPRLLKHEADARIFRHDDFADEAIIEAGENAEQRGLAAAGRPHQHRHAVGHDIEDEVADRGNGRPVDPDMGLLLDADFKPACCASGSNVVQGAVPVDIRWRA